MGQSSREVAVTEDSDVEKNWYGPVAAATVAGVAANVGGAQDAIVLGAAVVGVLVIGIWPHGLMSIADKAILGFIP